MTATKATTSKQQPRLFVDDAAVRHIGEGLLARTLPKSEWTHEAHLAALTYLLLERPDVDVDARIASIIADYNASVGGENTDTAGYHDSITRCFVAGARHYLAETTGQPLVFRVNALLQAPAGDREWPLRFYSRELLFSVPARRGFVPPDRAPLP